MLTLASTPTEAERLRETIQGIGLELCVATGLDEAIEMLHRHSSISLLLLDIDQPGTEPRPLLRQLRTSFTWAGLSFILLLRENDTETGELLESYGVSDYLYKPFTPEELQVRVKAVLTR